MKKILTIIALALLAANTFGQQSQKIRELEEFLMRHGFVLINKYLSGGLYSSSKYMANTYRVSVPSPADSMNVEKVLQQRQEFDSINAIQRQEQEAIWDSIRIFVNELTPEASECYLHEDHKDGQDNITYTFKFIQEGGGKEEDNGGVNIRLNYHQGPIFNNKAYHVDSYYYINYFGPRTRGMDDAHSFDVDGFELYLEKVLAPILKKKGVKQHPIHWEYDDSYPMADYQNNQELFLYPSLSLHTPTKPNPPYQVVITGTDYFIPIAYIDSTNAFLRWLETEVVEYLVQHPEKNFSHSSRHGYSEGPKGNQIWDFYPIHVFLNGWPDTVGIPRTEYSLIAYTEDEEGLHILSIKHPHNERWFPVGFQKMKSWKNGKAKYRR